MATGASTPHEILCLINAYGIDLFDLSWLNLYDTRPGTLWGGFVQLGMSTQLEMPVSGRSLPLASLSH